MLTTRRIALFFPAFFFCAVVALYADCPVGDLNADCQVTLLDVQVFAEQWLASPLSPADLDGDEEVNLDDFSLLAAHWHTQNIPLLINEFMASNGNYIVDPQGEHEDWIEIHNVGSVDIDMAGMYLTDDLGNPTKWKFPGGNPSLTTIKAGGYLIVWADNDVGDSGLHAAFELDAGGDQIALYDTDGITLIDAVDYQKQTTDVSYGRYPNATAAWSYFGVPRPWMENVDPYLGVVADTQFSHDRGFYDEPFELTIATETDDATIYYTIDGSDPSGLVGATRDEGIYTGPLTITTTTCVRALAVKPGFQPANVDTQTYLFLSDVIQQPTSPPGWPTNWGHTGSGDYEMDPDVVNHSAYRNTMIDDMKAVSTLSVVMNMVDLFGSGGKGIYMEGETVERACSAELIVPESDEQFQINCCVMIVGGSSTDRWKMDKLSMRLKFKSKYGPPTLRFPIFGLDAADEFNTLVLDARMNHSWGYGGGVRVNRDGLTLTQRDTAQYTRDQYVSDLQNVMGGHGTHGRHVHLYLNGLYWGLYWVHERPDEHFAAAYFGGEPDDYDALKHSASSVVSGVGTDYNKMFQIANGGLTSDTAYQQIQQYLDLEEFADYMIANYFTGNWDWAHHNWYATRSRLDPASRWRYHSWDAEHVMESISQNVTGKNDSGGPTRLQQRLIQNETYRAFFADRVHKHFFNDGTITPEEAARLYQIRCDEVDRAVVGESARWGDNHRSTPYTRDIDWVAERDWLLGEYFPQRTAVVLDQFKSRGWYPGVGAPVFAVNDLYMHGGYVTPQDMLSMSSAGGTIYYTLDGSDPQDPNTSNGGGPVVVLATEDAPKRVLIPTGPVSEDWKGGAPFDDSAWTPVIGGPGGVGYERSSGYQDYISLDVEDQMYRQGTGCYLRIPFTLEADPAVFNQMTLKVRYDDGFVAYLNGVEIYRAVFTGNALWDSTADGNHEAEGLESFYVSDHLGDLRQGENVLALHGINVSITSSDFIISGELAVTTGSSSGGGSSSGSIEYEGPFSLTATTQVKARTLMGSSWSALNEAVYAIGPVAESLRITEIMYHPIDPADPNDPNDPNEEYIELVNAGGETVNLNFVSFTNGVDFTFGNIELAPGQRTLVVEDTDAFVTRYGQGLPVAGQYDGKLANNGERVRLVDAMGTPIHDFTYDDNWRPITDTHGYSLTIIEPDNLDPNSWAEKDSWRASVYAGGSPGTDDSGVLPNPGDVVVNEVLAHSHDEASDWIELHNTTDHAINIGGWYLSDSASDLKKYRIASGTTIGAHQYRVFHETTHFGSGSVDPGAKVPFALSENGETVLLSSAIGNELTGYRESQDFGASATGVSFGRYFKGSTGNYNFVPMSYPTVNAGNAYPKVGPVIISEIMYNPTWPAGGSYTNDQYEYIEIRNTSAVPVILYRYDKSEPWKITDGVDFTFPDSPNEVAIGPGDYLVIAKKPEAFMWRHPEVPSEKILGPYESSLNNAGERVQLSSPGDVDKFGVRHYIREDRVVYSDGSHPQDQPGGIDLWPTSPDGYGDSLHRIDDSLYGNDPNNWQAAPPTPGL